jgi:hypothetical protein
MKLKNYDNRRLGLPGQTASIHQDVPRVPEQQLRR